MASHAAEVPLGGYDIVSAEAVDGDRQVIIQWGDGHISRFPYIWLRHHEYFPALGRPDQGDESPFKDPEDPQALSISELAVAERRLEISWNLDGSRTGHDVAWLRDHCLSFEARRLRQPKPVYWKGAEAAAFPWLEASDLNDPVQRLVVFRRLRDYGVVCSRNLSPAPGQVADLAEIFGPARRTHHGTLFNIRSLPQDRMGAGKKIGATASSGRKTTS